MTPQSETSVEPTVHTRLMRERLEALIDHLREDVDKVEDPRAQALFETSAEVLTGLKTAYEHYEEKSEEAWR